MPSPPTQQAQRASHRREKAGLILGLIEQAVVTEGGSYVFTSGGSAVVTA